MNTSAVGSVCKETLSTSRLKLLWPVLYVVLTTAMIFAFFSQWAYDDPFITYRYAQNLNAGNGFVYNPGAPTLSTTTPLFAIVLALLSNLWPDIPTLANLLGALSLALGAIFMWDLARTWKSPLVGWTALLLYPTFPLLISTLGSETPIYLAFCLGVFALYARGLYTASAVTSALLVLIRPDGILVPAIIALDYLLQKRGKIPWRAVLVFIAILLPWVIFSWIYFGSPLPATLAAKQHQGSMAISQRFAAGFLTILEPYARTWYFWFEAGLAATGIIWIAWRARSWSLILFWTGLYFIAYTVLGVSRYYWYYAPLVPGFIMAIGLGISALSFLLTKNKKTSWKQPAGLSVAALSLALLLGFAQVASLVSVRKGNDPRIPVYRQIGEWLDENVPLDAEIGALEIGAIGYYSQRMMIDFAGLLQPEVASHLTPGTTYADAALWAVQHYHPGYLVLHAGLFPELEQGYINQYCSLLKQFDGSQAGYDAVLNVYRCQPG